MQVKLGESVDIIYEFQTFEASRLNFPEIWTAIGIKAGQSTTMRAGTFLSLDDFDSLEVDGVISILAEYGNPTTLTIYACRSMERKSWTNNAVETIQTYFK